MISVRVIFCIILQLIINSCASLQVDGTVSYAELDTSRLTKITAWLPYSPQGLGPRCADRAAWGAYAVAGRLSPLMNSSNKLLAKSLPKWNIETYLKATGQDARPRGERIMSAARLSSLYPLVLAECAEGKGRFLPAIEQTLTELNAESSWNWPAYDGPPSIVRNQDYIDLLAAETAYNVAQALYMLGGQINPAVSQHSMAMLDERIFSPMRRSLIVGVKDNWWLQANNNWNAVCLADIVGAALAVLPDRQDRAIFVAAGEHYIRKYIAGFSGDGYSLEGPGYWNYGFSNFTILRELLMQATTGHIDLFTDPAVRDIALYGYRIEMLPSNVADFGDASRNTKIDDFIRAYTNEVFTFGMPQRLVNLPIPVYQAANSGPIVTAVMKLFTQPAKLAQPRESIQIGLQSYFDQVGVLISRPVQGGRFGVSIKAGGNGSHSHNDIGSYVIGLGAEQPTGDLGKPVYSAKTFGKMRYTIKSINSYGHPVPLVAGELQRDATKVKPKVLVTNFTDEADTITIDMTSAYSVPSLKKLTRLLRHERAGVGLVKIEDEFEFTTPQTFEVALISGGSWKDLGDGKIELWQKKEHLIANIDSSSPYEIIAEKIEEEGMVFTRIAIRLNGKLNKGYIKLTFEPV